MGKRITIGDVELLVECPTIRCPATQVHPKSGQRDAELSWPNFPEIAFPVETAAATVLSGGRKGSFVGLYAKIVSGGVLRPGQPIATERPLNIKTL